MTGPTRVSFLRLGAVASVAVLALVVTAHHASATVIIFDTFTGANNTALIGRLASPTDVPGNAYEGNGNVSLVGGPTGGTPYEADIQNNAARVGGDAGLGINLNIATAQQFQLSITFNISGDTETQATNIHRGAGLGFFSSVALGSSGSSHCFNNFTGLVVDIAGNVRLIVAGADSGLSTTVGGFNPAITHTFSYIVDTTAGVGTMSNILLDGTSVSLSAPVNTFTIARAKYGGFYNSAAATDLADFPDFYIATIPEPTTSLGLFSFLFLVCLRYLWVGRRTKRI